MNYQELSARAALIRESIAALHGADLAFAAASVSHLRVIQYGSEQAMRRILREAWVPVERKEEMLELIQALDKTLEEMFLTYYIELCKFLKLDAEKALEVARAFEQLTRDICGLDQDET